jgi:hypothetical protein
LFDPPVLPRHKSRRERLIAVYGKFYMKRASPNE